MTPARRWVVVGAGAVGGVIGGRLAQAGEDVVLVARGAHADALEAHGLLLRDPDAEARLTIPVARSVAAVDWREGDVALLATKTQQTAAVVADLAASAPRDTTVACAQNGLENERLALRHFPDVLGICVMLPAVHLQPGEVLAHSSPVSGLLEVGAYPGGLGTRGEELAAALSGATFLAEARNDVMRWKAAKLLVNLGNAFEALLGPGDAMGGLYLRARAEGEEVLAAAGIEWVDAATEAERRGDHLRMRRVAGERRAGGSTWQSIARGTGDVETDYLNGEIVLLGRLHGVATPVNEAITRVTREVARAGGAPGSIDVERIEAAICRLS